MALTAMVLAAGRGERIAPLSLSVAKPALPVLGKPLVLRTVERLAGAGLTRLAVNLHHRGDSVRDALGDAPIEDVHYSPETDLLGTGGGVRRVLPFLAAGEGPVVVWNGDAHADVDVAAALEAHRGSGRRATMVLVEGDLDRYGAVRCDGGRVTGFDRLAVTPPEGDPFVFAGVHVIDPPLLQRLPAEGPSDLVVHLYRPMLDAGEEVGAYLHPGRWIEIGDPALYRDTVLEVAAGADDLGRTWLGDGLPAYPRDEGLLLAAPDADASHAVRIEGRVVMESATTAAEGASLANSVILEGATVGPGARLGGCVLGPGASVPPGAELRNVAAARDPGPGEPVPAGAVRRDGLVIRDLAGSPR